MQISVKSDVDKALNCISVLQRKQMPFAAALGLTNMTKKVMKVEQRMLKAIITASVALVASSAVAYLDTVDTVISGGSISAILPIAVVVVLGLVWLGILDRKKRKRGSKRRHKSKRR